MVAIAEPPAYKVWSALAVIPGGLLRVLAIARTADEAMPKLIERAGRFRRPIGNGELFNPPEVLCKATVKAMNFYCLLSRPEDWTAEELIHVAEQEIANHRRHEAIASIRAERINSDLLFLQRQIQMRTP